ncbi:MAG: hypothetical protein QNJ92_08505 [Alphaproteobacteria bacterium]|nr:hypothetical protein [Alphaproteobacteria bacterium]
MRDTMIHMIAIVMTAGLVSGASTLAFADDTKIKSGNTSLTPVEKRFRKSHKATSLTVPRHRAQQTAPAQPAAGQRDEATGQPGAAGPGADERSASQETPTAAD